MYMCTIRWYHCILIVIFQFKTRVKFVIFNLVTVASLMVAERYTPISCIHHGFRIPDSTIELQRPNSRDLGSRMRDPESEIKYIRSRRLPFGHHSLGNLQHCTL